MGTTYKYDSTDDVNALKKMVDKADALSAQMDQLRDEIMGAVGSQIEELDRVAKERESLVEPVSKRCYMILEAGGTAEDLLNGGVDHKNAHKMAREFHLCRENPIGFLIQKITES